MREVISTKNAPGAIGPYSQAIKTDSLIFASGQIALDPETGQIVEGGIVEQTHRVMKNITAILEAAGSSLARVVKTTVFLKDFNDFGAMNEIYGGYFSSNPPARSTVEAARLPKDVKIEIEVIALV